MTDVREESTPPAERIAPAAADLLQSGGIDAVSTRAVAAAAGVQPPTIYRQFGDKDGLLDAVAGLSFRHTPKRSGCWSALEATRTLIYAELWDIARRIRRGATRTDTYSPTGRCDRGG